MQQLSTPAKINEIYIHYFLKKGKIIDSNCPQHCWKHLLMYFHPTIRSITMQIMHFEKVSLSTITKTA